MGIAKWLTGRFEKWASKTQSEELAHFTLSLKGQSRAELGMLVAMSTVMRANLSAAGILPDRALGLGLPLSSIEEAEITSRISRLTKEFQSAGQMANAAAAMVWLHTMRSILRPELRLMGRQMWLELERGFCEADDQLDALTEMLPDGKVPYLCRLMLKEIPQQLSPQNY